MKLMTATAQSRGSLRFRHAGNTRFLRHKGLTLNLNHGLLTAVPFGFAQGRRGGDGTREAHLLCLLFNAFHDAVVAGHCRERYSDGSLGHTSSHGILTALVLLPSWKAIRQSTCERGKAWFDSSIKHTDWIRSVIITGHRGSRINIHTAEKPWKSTEESGLKKPGNLNEALRETAG